MARRQSLAGLIKELANQQRIGFQPGRASNAVPVKLRLNIGEYLGVDDRCVVAWPGLPAMIDLPEVMAIAQDMGERPAGQIPTANRPTRRRRRKQALRPLIDGSLSGPWIRRSSDSAAPGDIWRGRPDRCASARGRNRACAIP
jgi:hypothetical protein